MRKSIVTLGLALLAGATLADDLAEKIKPGLTRDAVVALIGSPPDEEGCKTYIGVSACKLIWSKGIVGRTRYEVEFIAGRVVTVQVMKAKGIF